MKYFFFGTGSRARFALARFFASAICLSAGAFGCTFAEFNNPDGFSLGAVTISGWDAVEGSLKDSDGNVVATRGGDSAPRTNATSLILDLTGLSAGDQLAFYFTHDCSGTPVASGAVSGDGTFQQSLDLSGLSESDSVQQLYGSIQSQAQNVGCSQVGIGLTIDRTAPTVGGLVDDATATRSKTWSWVCSEPCGSRFVIDGSPSGDPTGSFGPIQNAAAGSTTVSTGDGTKYLRLQVKDAAGNISATTIVSAVLDNTPPLVPSSLTLLTSPATSNDTSPLVEVGGVNSGDFIKLYKSAGCSSSDQVAGETATGGTVDLESSTLPDGSYTFYATATDAAGNESACSGGGAAYTLDATAPVITDLSDDATPAKSKTWTWSCSGGPCTYTYIVDTSSGTIAGDTYDGTTTVSQSSGTGTYYLHIRARDSVGNFSAQVDVSAVLDNTPPVPGATPIEIASGVAHTYSRSQSVSFNASGATTMCIAGNTDCSGCTDYSYAATKTISLSGTGTKDLSVKFKDAAGNESSCSTDSIELTDLDGGPEPNFSGKGSFFDRVYTADGSACILLSGATKWSECAIGGGYLKFPTRLASCSGLSLVDSRGWISWSCSVQGGYAVFSGGVDLKNHRITDFMNLSTPAAPAWKTATLTLNDGAAHTGGPTTWWSDGLQALPPSTGGEQLLNSGHTFYVATSSQSTRGYQVGAMGVGIVAPSGVTLTWDSGGPVNCHQGVVADNKKRVISGNEVSNSIIQIDIDGASKSAEFGVLFSSTTTGAGQVIAGTTISSMNDSGLLLEAQDLSWIHDVSVENSTVNGMKLIGMAGLRMENVNVQSVSGPGGGNGISIQGGYDIDLKSAKVANTALTGLIAVGSSGLVVENLHSSNMPHGVDLLSSDDAVLSGLLVGDTLFGVLAVDTSGLKVFRSTVVRSRNSGFWIARNTGTVDNVLIDGVLVGSAANYGISFTDASNITLLNVAVAGAGTAEFRVADVNTLTALGNVVINRAAGGCSLSGTNTGVAFTDGDCSGETGDPVTGWNLEIGLSLSNAFVLPPGTKDSMNTTSALTNANRVAYSSITDWWNFEGDWRLWGDQGDGTGGDVMGQSVASAICTSGETCQVWDYSLKLNSPVTRRTATYTSTNTAFTQNAACPSELTTSATVTLDGQTGLRLAVEDLADGKGDDDGVCEEGESCLYLQDFGFFQGEYSAGKGYCNYPSNTYSVWGFTSAGFNIP